MLTALIFIFSLISIFGLFLATIFWFENKGTPLTTIENLHFNSDRIFPCYQHPGTTQSSFRTPRSIKMSV